jgi:hypothetical protein
MGELQCGDGQVIRMRRSYDVRPKIIDYLWINLGTNMSGILSSVRI